VAVAISFASARAGCVKLMIVGRDEYGEVRAVELAGPAFFIAPLFQPEQSAFLDAAHPLICAFLQAAMNWKRTKSCHALRPSAKTDHTI